MKNLIITIIGTILFFGFYILVDYLFGGDIDWKTAIIFSIIFAIFEAFCQSQRNKKSDK